MRIPDGRRQALQYQRSLERSQSRSSVRKSRMAGFLPDPRTRAKVDSFCTLEAEPLETGMGDIVTEGSGFRMVDGAEESARR